MINISDDKKFTEKTALVFIVMSLIIGAVFGNVIGYNRGYHDGFDLRDTVEPYILNDDINTEISFDTVIATQNLKYNEETKVLNQNDSYYNNANRITYLEIISDTELNINGNIHNTSYIFCRMIPYDANSKYILTNITYTDYNFNIIIGDGTTKYEKEKLILYLPENECFLLEDKIGLYYNHLGDY